MFADKVAAKVAGSKQTLALRGTLRPKQLDTLRKHGHYESGFKSTVKRYLYFDGLGCVESVEKKYLPLEVWKPILKDEDGFPLFKRSLIDNLPITCRGHSSGDKTTARYLGRYPLKVGKRPGRLDRPSVAAKMFLASDYCPKFVTDKNIDNWLLASGSWDTNWHQLDAMARVDFPDKPNSARYVRILRDNIDDLALPLLDIPEDWETYHVQYNLHAGCGGDWSVLGKKGSVWGSISETARVAFHRVTSDLVADQSVYTVGARERRLKKLERGDLVKSRLVLNQDPVSAALCKIFTNKIEHWFKSEDSKQSPFYIGHTNAHNGWLRYAKDVVDADMCLEGDWDDFDTCANSKIIAAAFAMARSMFPPGKEIDNAFFWMCSGFIAKHVVTPDGLLYRVDKGIPSGNAWTSIIGTFINYLLWMDIVRNAPHLTATKPRYSFLLCGDDFVINFKDPLQQGFSFKKLAKWIRDRSGFSIREDYKLGKPCVKSEEDCITFLKTAMLIDNLPATTWKDLFTRIMLPSKRYDILHQPDKFLNFLINQSQCLPRGQKALCLLSRYLAYCLEYASFKSFPKKRSERIRRSYLDQVKQIRCAIRILTSKIYFSSDERFKSDIPKLKVTGSDRWSFYNLADREDDEVTYVNLEANQVLCENWLFENLSYKEPSADVRSCYVRTLVGEALSQETVLLFS